MSKKKTPSKVEQPGYVTELLEKGTVILRAATRDEFGEMIDVIPASVRYAAGAIGKNPTTGLYQLRIDIIND
jgi:hypothetical protein